MPKDRILDWFNFKGFADDMIILAEITRFVFYRIEDIVGKGENAGYQHFLLFPQCFLKGFLPRVVNSCDCMVNKSSHIQ